MSLHVASTLAADPAPLQRAMDAPALATLLVSGLTLAYLLRWFFPGPHQLKHIPAIGPTAPVLSYWGAIQWMLRGTEITQQGYNKYKGRAFKVANFNRWLVIVSGPKLIDDVRKAADSELSFIDAANENLELRFTAGPNVAENSYHVAIVRGQLTRSLHILFPNVHGEINAAFHDAIPPSDDWASLPALPTVMQVVARATNRVFVGLPKCRDPDYLDLSIQFTVDLMLGAHIVTQFPPFLKPLAARLFTRVPSAVRRGRKHLRGMIEERLALYEEHGHGWDERPRDMLSWLIEEAESDERTVDKLVLRILTLNFAAIHTTSMSFTYALFQLAAYPEYAIPMRTEIERIVRHEGWTKQSMDKMHKVDSFLKESQRMYALGGVTMVRKAMKDFTFSDGTFIPKGTFVGVAVLPTHHDIEYYDDPDTFNPWRFSDMRTSDGDSGRYSMVSTSVEYHPFGHGRHACPGRFFAAIELKLMLAHVVMAYDVKMEPEGVVPPYKQFGQNIAPDAKARVVFRKRR